MTRRISTAQLLLTAACAFALAAANSCLMADFGGDDDPAIGMLEAYGIDPASAEEAGTPLAWPAQCQLPAGARAVKSGSGSSEFGPYILVRCDCRNELIPLINHFEAQAAALGHQYTSFELGPDYLTGSTASGRQSMVLAARRAGGKAELYIALVEEYDEFFRPGRSVTFNDINALPPGFPSDRLPLISGARLNYASYSNTKMVELNCSVRSKAETVRNWYRAQMGALGFQHSEEISSAESSMVGDIFTRGIEGAMIEIYDEGKSCRVVCSYGDGTASIWD